MFLNCVGVILGADVFRSDPFHSHLALVLAYKNSLNTQNPKVTSLVAIVICWCGRLQHRSLLVRIVWLK